MKSITFKLSKRDIVFLSYVSEKTGSPLSSIYRDKTIEFFHDWKISYLLKDYENGKIGLKKFCNLANISFNEGLLLLEKHEIEPPIPEILDNYTTLKMEELDYSFKQDIKPERKSPVVESDE